MTKEELIYLVESLGFKRYSEVDGVSYYSFNHSVAIEIVEVMDYYTSYWGNHPVHYELKLWLSGDCMYHSRLDEVTPVMLFGNLDYVIQKAHRGVYGGSKSYQWDVLVYEKSKKLLLSQMIREEKLKIIGL